MQPDRLDVGKVQALVKEFWETKMSDDDDLEPFEESRVTQAIVDEMNVEMKAQGQEVNVSQVIWEILVDDDDDYFKEEWASEFESWVEENCS